MSFLNHIFVELYILFVTILDIFRLSSKLHILYLLF